MPRISVIMNCAYGVRFLKEAIDSVFNQSFDDWEIVFVDNCSTDGSADLARSYADTGRVRFVRTEQRIPLYAARNVGLDQAQGEFVAFNDVDDVLEHDALERLLNAMRDNLTFVYGGYRYIDANGDFLPRKIQGHAAGNITNRLLLRAFIAIGCILVRKETLSRERFDPTYNILGDYEMWTRLSATGHACDYVDAYLTRIRVHGANTSILEAKRWIVEERRFYRAFLKRHGLRYPMILAAIPKYEISSLIARKRI